MTTVDIPEAAIHAGLQAVEAALELRWIGNRGEVEMILRAAAPYLIASHLRHVAIRYTPAIFHDYDGTPSSLAGASITHGVLIREAERLLQGLSQ